jgi:hypothetical protein
MWTMCFSGRISNADGDKSNNASTTTSASRFSCSIADEAVVVGQLVIFLELLFVGQLVIFLEVGISMIKCPFCYIFDPFLP